MSPPVALPGIEDDAAGRSVEFRSDQHSLRPLTPPPSSSSRKLFIRGLDYSTPVEELRSIFNEYGEIEECVIPTERGSGKSK
jgi:RNA recognition motif-containing protein